jgi:hypothetical protein
LTGVCVCVWGGGGQCVTAHFWLSFCAVIKLGKPRPHMVMFDEL